ncbi:MAG: hypothetical protein HC938_06145 [Nitrospira sp.]|nr:hypothetical protein [Nitrospira sp.]
MIVLKKKRTVPYPLTGSTKPLLHAKGDLFESPMPRLSRPAPYICGIVEAIRLGHKYQASLGDRYQHVTDPQPKLSCQ